MERGDASGAAMKSAVRVLALIVVASAVGCDPHANSKMAEQQADINLRVSVLETRVSTLELQAKQHPAGNWTLWQVSEALNAGYPQALSAYSSKDECVTAAGSWSFPGGTVLSQDPTIFQLKGYRIRLECLPVGVSPYGH